MPPPTQTLCDLPVVGFAHFACHLNNITVGQLRLLIASHFKVTGQN
jgi:hypothetical protein